MSQVSAAAGMRALCLLLFVGAQPVLASPPPPPAAPAPVGDGVVVEWHGGNGWVLFTIDRRGLARYHFHPTGFGAEGRRDERRELPLKPEQVERLRRDLVTHKVCELRSQRPHPVPEEREALLKLAFPGPGPRCEVRMWSNEWGDIPQARPAASAIETLVELVRTTGTAPAPAK